MTSSNDLVHALSDTYNQLSKILDHDTAILSSTLNIPFPFALPL